MVKSEFDVVSNIASGTSEMAECDAKVQLSTRTTHILVFSRFKERLAFFYFSTRVPRQRSVIGARAKPLLSRPTSLDCVAAISLFPLIKIVASHYLFNAFQIDVQPSPTISVMPPYVFPAPATVLLPFTELCVDPSSTNTVILADATQARSKLRNSLKDIEAKNADWLVVLDVSLLGTCSGDAVVAKRW